MENYTEIEKKLSRRLLDVLIQVGLIIALVAFCYKIFAPFMTIMLWALILAVTLFPLQQKLAHQLGGRQGRAATILVLLGVLLLVVPAVFLASSLGDSIVTLVHDIKNNTLAIPAPAEKVAHWPIVGEKIYWLWSQAATDLPALIQSIQPKIGNIAKKALEFVAGLGSDMLKFLVSFIIAGVIMAYGQSAHSSIRAISCRFVGAEKGDEFATLSTATVRAVAQGVIGIAFLQAILIGVALMIAGIPFAGALAILALVLGIAQLPALLITLPAIAYIWMSGNYETVAASLYTLLLIIVGMADNILKPILLGRGVNAPMPVILLGALGGMVSAGILGMFIGAVLLALGYQIFMAWVAMHQADAAVTADPPQDTIA